MMSYYRCLPYFYLIGVSKSGTCDLYDAIKLHPKIAVPNRKEPTYFNRIRWNGIHVSSCYLSRKVIFVYVKLLFTNFIVFMILLLKKRFGPIWKLMRIVFFKPLKKHI